MPTHKLRAVPNENGCWIVVSHQPGSHGYVEIKRDQHRVLAHRYVYERYVGSIPEGAMICHRCDCKLCVNPDHLYVGDVRSNAQDALRNGRTACGERNGSARLTWDKVREIRRSTLPLKQEAAKHGVSRVTIWYVRKGLTWREE